MSKTSDGLREEWSRNDALRDSGLKTPEDIVRFDNISYGSDEKWNLLDVYRPRDKAVYPVIIIVHGGAWVYGTKETYQFFGMNLAQHGFGVVNYTYRLAPEHKFPAQLKDTNAAVKWTLECAGEYGLDASRLALIGDSAGAQILGLYLSACTNADYMSHFDFSLPGNFRPAAAVFNCGVYEMLYSSVIGEREDRELIGDILSDGEESLELLHVTANMTEGFPSCFVASGVGDFMEPQVELMCSHLRRLNIYHESKI